MAGKQGDGAHALEEGKETWAQNSSRNPRAAVTPIEGQFPMHNAINVQFETPKVPVIFILGGPGSGKVTHCDNLMQEKYGVIHINMTDILQQYAVGNEMQDFSLLSSKTVTEVLMLEMKMAPTAKTYLVSGYPRNMRDVVEYSERIQVINGVILISWRQKVLERQIDYGAKLGQVVLSLARMELNNFYKQVMPVADYFDQNNMLVAINGERHPGEVFKDFREAVLKILGMQDNPPIFSNGSEANLPTDLTTELPKAQTLPNVVATKNPTDLLTQVSQQIRPQTQVLSVNGNAKPMEYQSPVKPGWPPVLWVIGGPGSNKAVLCEQAAKETGWNHISLGRLLRATADSSRTNSDASKIRTCIINGEMVPLDIIMKIVESHMGEYISSPGIILDGFPRDLNQVAEFESKFKQKPSVILLDCSKLQLGRGRLDDSVTAFRRRLEIFRQSSLPMLKAMDNIGRLTIVDGDTDTTQVQEDFKNVVKEHIQYLRDNIAHNEITNSAHIANGNIPNGHSLSNGRIPNGTIGNGRIAQGDDTVLHDLEDEPIQTISKNVNLAVANGIHHMAQQQAAITIPKISNK
ncbi:hypothetical protein QE152_g13691 [Popillia japonica]|uniref:Adenylate kinase isoenzyme 5 n=1 Tax=Popillia japonica TaxID=7064 RepID=A0AAW1LCK6_POPJA